MHEYYNPQNRTISCTFPAPFGRIRILPGEAVPTAKMEQKGIVAELFRPFVKKSFLHPTTDTQRRRLSQGATTVAPKTTSDLASSSSGSSGQETKQEAAKVSVTTSKSVGGGSLPDDLQAKVDASASSTKKGKIETP